MACRSFNGTSDYLRLNVGGAASMTFGTFAVLMKVPSTGGVKTPLCLLDSGQTYVLTPCQVTAAVEAVEFDGIQIIATYPTAVWVLLVVRKATGTVAPRVSYYNYNTTTWTHSAPAGTHANWTAPTSGFVNTGTAGDASSEPFQGQLAATAIWANSLPWTADTTGDSNLVAAGLHTAASSWLSSNPSTFWLWNQASTATAVTDSSTTGTGSQAAISGTSVITNDDPPGFSFALSPQPTAVGGGGQWACF